MFIIPSIQGKIYQTKEYAKTEHKKIVSYQKKWAKPMVMHIRYNHEGDKLVTINNLIFWGSHRLEIMTFHIKKWTLNLTQPYKLVL